MNRLTALLFACFGLACGLAVMATTPVGEVADEPAHLIRSDSLSRGFLIGSRRPSEVDANVMEGAAPTDPGLHTMARRALDADLHPMTKAGLDYIMRTPWEHQTRWLQIGQIAAYMPAFYAPSAITLWIGRILDVTPYHSTVAARLVDLLVFLAMGTLALLIARRGQAVLLWTLSVPMTLSLAAAVHQDGLLIAASVLAAAAASRSWDQIETPDLVVRQGWYWTAVALVSVIAAAKPPYMGLAVMLLLPLPENWRSRNARDALLKRCGVMIAACVPALLWLAVANPRAAGNLGRLPYEAGPLWDGPRPAVFHNTDLHAQLHVLLSDPWRLIDLPVHAIVTNPNLWHESVGVLGWLNVVLPLATYQLWWAAAVLAIGACLLRRRAGGASSWVRPALEALLLLAGALAAIWAVYISQYLTWTNVGNTLIEGPTGRYFLPVAPLLALALAPLAGRRMPDWVSHGLAWAPMVMLVAMIYVLPRMLVLAFNMK